MSPPGRHGKRSDRYELAGAGRDEALAQIGCHRDSVHNRSVGDGAGEFV